MYKVRVERKAQKKLAKIPEPIVHYPTSGNFCNVFTLRKRPRVKFSCFGSLFNIPSNTSLNDIGFTICFSVISYFVSGRAANCSALRPCIADPARQAA